MLRRVFLALGVACLVGPISAQEPTPEQKKKIAELKDRIAAKKEELAKLEAELAKLAPPPPDQEVRWLKASEIKTGQVGQFGSLSFSPNGIAGEGPATLRVEKVIDDKSMIISFRPVIHPTMENRLEILVKNFDTKDIADGKIFQGSVESSPRFRVLGTEKVAGKTYFAVEPHTPPKK